MSKLKLFSIILFTVFACKKECYKDYQFVVPVSIVPIKDTIKTKDTLWLNLNFSDNVLDYRTNQTYKLENFDFKLALLIRRIEFDTIINLSQPGAYREFDIVYKTGVIDDWSHPTLGWGSLKPVYDNNKYKLKAGFIPKDTGLFYFTVFRDLDDNHNGGNYIHVTNTKCIEYLNFLKVLVNDGNTNLYLLKNKSLIREVPNDYTIWSDTKSSYTFYVKP